MLSQEVRRRLVSTLGRFHAVWWIARCTDMDDLYNELDTPLGYAVLSLDKGEYLNMKDGWIVILKQPS